MPIKRVPCLGKFYCQQAPSKWATNPYSIGFSIPTSTRMMHFGRKLMNSWFYALCMVLVFLHWGGQRTKEGINRANSFMQIFWCSQYFNLADHYLKFCCEAPLCDGGGRPNCGGAHSLIWFKNVQKVCPFAYAPIEQHLTLLLTCRLFPRVPYALLEVCQAIIFHTIALVCP